MQAVTVNYQTLSLVEVLPCFLRCKKCPFICFFLVGTVHFYSPVRAADVAKEEAAVLHQ